MFLSLSVSFYNFWAYFICLLLCVVFVANSTKTASDEKLATQSKHNFNMKKGMRKTIIVMYTYIYFTEEMIALVVEKLQGVPNNQLVLPIRTIMNIIVVLEQLKKKEPDIDLKESIEVIENMDKAEFHTIMWDTSM